VVQTPDTAVLEALERIATAQVIMAAAMSIITLIAIGGAVILLLELRSYRALQREIRLTLNQLRPRLMPLLEEARSVTGDAARMSDDVRRRVDAILHTIEELHRSLKRGGAAAEERVRRFDAVLDIVQGEAEELLLDAAATAHGVHETARTLRESPRRRSARALDDDEEEIL
jgi:flagellar biosynthesis/type III secretory pathway chaperone